MCLSGKPLGKEHSSFNGFGCGLHGYKHFAWYDGCDGRRDTLLVHSIYRGIYTCDTPERGAKGRTVKTLKCRQAMLAVIFGSGLTE